MTGIRSWLEEQGLGEYADAFERNDIGLDLLPELTGDELRQLGVERLGHRVRLRKAFATLRQKAIGADRALERRQVTVMFCDMVGSTALAERVDPEDLRRLMQSYQQACGAVIEHYEGHVAQYLGDGLVVYFGWPKAHEDTAQRAILAALSICDAVRSLPTAQPLQVRIGIATGAVVVGESGDGDASVPKVAIGETPNVAARVQHEAGPGEIVIAASTRMLAGGAFDYVPLGERILKGLREPQRCWRVLGASQVADRFAAAHGAGLTPMTGRARELTLLMDAWGQALNRHGRVVVLSGESGIGKSRIVQTIHEQIGQGPAVVLRYHCSPYHVNSAFYPITKQLESDAGIQRTDSPEDRLDKLDRMLDAQAVSVPSAAPLHAALLSLPLDRYPPLNMSPLRQKAATIEVLTEGVLGLSQLKPVLMIVEDAHWIDHTTLEALNAIVKAISGAAVLLVITQRSEATLDWLTYQHVAQLTLSRLSPQETAELIGRVTGGKKLPAVVQDLIVAKSDGIPLFVEEVTTNVLASDRLVWSGNGYVLRGTIDDFDVPATLKDSLAARLNQLNAAKRVAQIGAVFGRQFRHDLLEELTDGEAFDVPDACEELLESGLAARAGSPPDVVYVFRHALIQDAAYDSLLKSERRHLHRRIADLLVEKFPELTQREPEVIARHYTGGGVYDKAVRYWLTAGTSAWQRSAAQEAIAHLTHGVDLLPSIDDRTSRDALELRLQATLGLVHFAATSYASPEAQSHYLRALELCGRVKKSELQFPVLYGIGAFQTMKGDIRTGHGTFEQLLTVAEASGQPRFQLYSAAVLAWSSYNRADFRTALQHADRVIALYDDAATAGPRLSAADPKIVSECFRAVTLWSLGFPDQAEAASEGVVRHARALGDPYSLAYTLNFAGLLIPDLCGQYARVLERTTEGIACAEEQGYGFLMVFGTLWRAWAVGQHGDVAGALDLMDAGLRRCRELGVRYHYSQLVARQAMLLARARECDRARALIEEAASWVVESGEASVQADVQSAYGAVALACGAIEEAERHYTEALQTARAQHAKGFELRAAIGLARLWRRQGKAGDAQALLAPLCDWFTEGLDGPDMMQAKRVLAGSPEQGAEKRSLN